MRDSRLRRLGNLGWRRNELAWTSPRMRLTSKAADLNVIYHQYGQRGAERPPRSQAADRGELGHMVLATSITGSKSDKSGGAGCAVQTDIRCGSKLLTFVR
jgi:hypothetical protein